MLKRLFTYVVYCAVMVGIIAAGVYARFSGRDELQSGSGMTNLSLPSMKSLQAVKLPAMGSGQSPDSLLKGLMDSQSGSMDLSELKSAAPSPVDQEQLGRKASAPSAIRANPFAK